MNIDELKGVLQIPASAFDDLLAQFKRDHSSRRIDDFLEYLVQNQHISETDRLQANPELKVELIEPGATFQWDSEGPLPGLSMQGILGEGAMGEVHLARDVALKRSVALKLIREDVEASEETKARFVREILITAQLDHPNIVPVYSVEQSLNESMAYTMKLVRGRTLGDIIEDCQDGWTEDRESEIMPINQRLEIFLKVCDAIYYAHSRGVIHRDLKPDNIMIGPFGEVFVMDWGIARVLDHVDDELDAEGALIGTLGYLAPEQALGDIDNVKGHSDQYSLGLILYELITLNKAIQDGPVPDLYRRCVRGQIKPIHHFVPKKFIRRELKAIISKASSFRIEDRYQSVDALAEDIRHFLREEPVEAEPDPFFERIKRWVHRNRTLAIGLFGMVLLIALGTNLVNVQIQLQNKERQRLLEKDKHDAQVALYEETEAKQVAQLALYAEKESAAEREEEQRRKSLARERSLVYLLSAVSTQSQQIDQQFLRYKGLLRALGASAESALSNKKPPSALAYTNQDFDSGLPPDLTDSIVYTKQVSLDYPVIKLAPGVALSEHSLRVRQLLQLQPAFYNTILRSVDEDAVAWSKSKARDYISNKGAPVVWAMVATKEGIHFAYPGKGQYKPGYDPRERPWYKGASGNGPHCSHPYDDAMGQGLLLPCNIVLRDSNREQIGVAGLDFNFNYIKSQLLALPRSIQADETYLVDEKGMVLIRSNQKSSLGEQPKYKAKRFPISRVVQAIQQKKSGYHLEWTVNGEQLAVYQRMGSMGWYYVAVGSSDIMLGL